MPYYIGGEITDRAQMAVQTPQSLHDKLNLDVRISTRVIKIDTADKKVQARSEVSGDTYEETYDHLILAVGAAPFKPPIPGIDRPGLFELRNLQDMDAIVAWLDKKTKEVGDNAGDLHCVVAGAGFVGLEMVEQLINRGTNVTLVEMMPQILGPLDVEMAKYLENDLVKRGVDVITGDAIQEFKAHEKDPESSILTLKSGKVLPPAQLTILGLGVRPDTKMVQEAGIECSPRGHIIVNDHLQTSIPNVWAVGDAVEVNNPLLPGEKWAVPLVSHWL
jgi:NADPH-dependent 2,4-dienoyl-CoA reductase/sulfur reductase-like enzyme